VTEDQAEEMLDLLKEISEKFGQQATGQSSVEVKSSTRGVDVAVKVYATSPLGETGTEALDEYFRLLSLAQQRILDAA